MAGIGVTTALEQVEPLRQPIQDLGRGERLDAGGGEFDGERERVEAGTELGDLLGRLDLRPLAKQRDGFGLGKRWHRILDLSLHAQERAARDEERQVGTCGEEGRELGRRLDHLLQVVEQEEQLALADVLGKPVLGAERLRDGLRDECGVAQGGEPGPEDASLVRGNERSCRLERKPGLAGTSGTGQRDQAGSALDSLEDLRELTLPADEGARRARQVRVRDGLERREGARAELEDRDRSLDVLQTVLAKVDQLVRPLLEQRDGRGRQHHLPAVGCAHDPGGLVHVHAHVLGRVESGITRVDADPDADRTRLQALHRLADRGHGALRGGERIEERIPFVVHLVASMSGERLPDHPPVLPQRRAICVSAEIFEQPGRSLHVREHQSHGARRLRVTHRTRLSPDGRDNCNVGARPDWSAAPTSSRRS